MGLILLVLLLFLADSITYMSRHRSNVLYHERLAQSVKGLEPGLIITDYIMYNEIDLAFRESQCSVALLNGMSLVDTRPLGPRDLLIEQADMGGKPTGSFVMEAFRKRLRDLEHEETQKIMEQIDSLLGASRNVYYIASSNRTYLMAEELELLSELRFLRVLPPAIFWFTRDRHDGR